MKVRTDDSGLLAVSLERGESIREEVETLARTRGVRGARVSAIGAVEDPELGYYDLQAREYRRGVLPGIWELLSLQGNLTLKDGEPFLHAHAVLGGPTFEVRGGHLFEARVGVVVEMFLQPLRRALARRPCPEIGLPRWEPDA